MIDVIVILKLINENGQFVIYVIGRYDAPQKLCFDKNFRWIPEQSLNQFNYLRKAINFHFYGNNCWQMTFITNEEYYNIKFLNKHRQLLVTKYEHTNMGKTNYYNVNERPIR